MLSAFSFHQPIVRWLNDQTAQGIFTTDNELIIRGWNRWLEAHTGRLASQIIGMHLFDAFPDIRERRLDSFYQDALGGQTQVLASRFHGYLISLPATHERITSVMQQTVRIAPLLSEGQIIGTITVIEDVTERVAYEEDLRRARDEAEAATRAKDQFIAILSHDLRTPLSAIVGWAQILGKSTADAARIKQGIQSILQNASVQLQMIDDLLDISRISAGKLSLEFEFADLIEIIHVAVESMRPSMEAKGVRFMQVLPVTRRNAWVDPKRITQVLWNLLSNAVKFTPKGGTVTFVVDFREDYAEFKVSDNGEGISAEALPHVFETMWQAEESGRSQTGLGLGLAIVHHVVSSHGGTVRAESAGIGLGASFVVQVPWTQPQQADDSNTGISQEASGGLRNW